MIKRERNLGCLRRRMGVPWWRRWLFEAYEDWCDDNAVVPWFKEQRTFKRELFTVMPGWKERQRRSTRDGMRDYKLEGMVMPKAAAAFEI